MDRIYSIVDRNGFNYKPFYLLDTNFEIGSEYEKYIVGVTASRVLVIVGRDNKLVYDLPAPIELKKYADKVVEFKKDPFWEIHQKRYFGNDIAIISDDDLL